MTQVLYNPYMEVTSYDMGKLFTSLFNDTANIYIGQDKLVTSQEVMEFLVLITHRAGLPHDITGSDEVPASASSYTEPGSP